MESKEKSRRIKQSIGLPTSLNQLGKNLDYVTIKKFNDLTFSLIANIYLMWVRDKLSNGTFKILPLNMQMIWVVVGLPSF